ncbi:MAG: cyclic pyranopterin phosphate synthase [Thermoproteota archaeon]|jgi:cyclic pyranopterin phosphate synthase
MSELTHIDQNNNPTMVSVGHKEITQRIAVAQSTVHLPEVVTKQIINGDIQSKKGPVFHTAIIAGTMAVKKTSDLIPFCHPLAIEGCNIHITTHENILTIKCEVKTTGKTGVEMEALTGASIAALTIYDMCKALSHEIKIEATELVEKSGGKRLIKEGKSCN